jgi:DNA repair protein RecO (recombination protein O)
MHTDYLNPAGARVLNLLLQMPVEELASLKLSGEERTELLAGMLKYYRLHLPGIREMRSLQVLRDIFR